MAALESEKTWQEDCVEYLHEFIQEAACEETPFVDALVGPRHVTNLHHRGEKHWFEVRSGNQIFVVQITRVDQ